MNSTRAGLVAPLRWTASAMWSMPGIARAVPIIADSLGFFKLLINKEFNFNVSNLAIFVSGLCSTDWII